MLNSTDKTYPPIGSVWQWRWRFTDGSRDEADAIIILVLLPDASQDVNVLLLNNATAAMENKHWSPHSFDCINGKPIHPAMTLIWGGPHAGE